VPSTLQPSPGLGDSNSTSPLSSNEVRGLQVERPAVLGGVLLPPAAEFDSEFAAADRSPGLRRVWQRAAPDLPPEIEPYSFVSVALLGHLADALALSPGTTLVDLGCGRGGPGLWLAQSRGAALIGVDFSAVAVQQATDRAARFGLATQARFMVGDLAATGLADGVADAVVSIDALHFAADPTAWS
jgi:SAM-dependent methyltransferase